MGRVWTQTPASGEDTAKRRALDVLSARERSWLKISIFCVPTFVASVNFANSDLLLISIHLFSLQMLLFHPNLIIAIVFFTANLIPPLSVFKRFQNSLARVIFPSLKRSDHITPALVKLHWLPIHKRIKFKIATITFKVLKNRQPSYLLDLLQPHNPQRSLRSSDKLLLDTPKIKTALATRSFSHAAPSVWNSLPFDLRNSSSLHSFTTHLKTHLFPP